MWLETFWLVITIISLVWYTAMTVYVGMRGGPEIIRLIRTLRSQADQEDVSPDSDQPEPLS